MYKNLRRFTATIAATLGIFAILQIAVSGQETKLAIEADSPSLTDMPAIYGPKLTGMWDTRVSIKNCVTGATLFQFDSLGLFGSDGTFLDTNSQNPASKSTTLGYWRHLTGNHYKFVTKFFRFDPATGTYLGTTVVRHNLELALDGQSYISSGTGTRYDTSGAIVPPFPGAPAVPGCSSAVAIRFK